MPKVFPKARLISRRDITPDLVIMRFEPDIHYPFVPGQYCTIGINDTYRPYSIASSPDKPYLELFIRLVKDGEFTPILWQLRVGDKVTLLPKAKGIFTFEERFENQVMIATGTGISPYVSIIRHYFRSRPLVYAPRNFYVFHGVSYQDEFGYDDELRNISPDFTYIPTVSRPEETRNTGWQGYGKRINRFTRWLLINHGIEPDNSIIYLCGNPKMLKDLSKKLPARAFLRRLKRTFDPHGYEIKKESFWVEPKNKPRS